MKTADGAGAATEARDVPARKVASSQGPDVGVVVEPDAQGFVEERSLAPELDAALEIAKECLTGTTRIRVELMEDPEEQDAPPSIVLRVDNSLSQPDFWNARKRFYGTVRSAGAVHLYEYLSIVRE